MVKLLNSSQPEIFGDSQQANHIDVTWLKTGLFLVGANCALQK